jgi:hypothetical protein
MIRHYRSEVKLKKNITMVAHVVIYLHMCTLEEYWISNVSCANQYTSGHDLKYFPSAITVPLYYNYMAWSDQVSK